MSTSLPTSCPNSRNALLRLNSSPMASILSIRWTYSDMRHPCTTHVDLLSDLYMQVAGMVLAVLNQYSSAKKPKSKDHPKENKKENNFFVTSFLDVWQVKGGCLQRNRMPDVRFHWIGSRQVCQPQCGENSSGVPCRCRQLSFLLIWIGAFL